MKNHRHTIKIHASPEKIFAIYSDVENWKSWDSEVISSSLDGSFKAGSIGSLKPKSGPKSKILIETVIPNISFCVSSKLPLCLMRFGHDLEKKGDYTLVTHSIHFSGPLSFLFKRLIGNQISKTLAHSLNGLKQKAEKA